MDVARGLMLWLAAALLGSSSATIVWLMFLSGAWTGQELRSAPAITIISLFWTVPGSGLLALGFAWMSGRGFALVARLGLTVLLGTVAGAAMMTIFGSSAAILLGLAYGLATGIAWAALYIALYGRAEGRVRAGNSPA